MHIDTIRLGNVAPFTEEVKFDFKGKVNVFIGANATGKTTLLQTISPNIAWRDIRQSFDVDRTFEVFVSPDWPPGADGFVDTRAVPWIYVPPIRTILPVLTDLSTRFLSSRNVAGGDINMALEVLPHRFEAEDVYDAVQIMTVNSTKPDETQIRPIMRRAYSVAKSVCREILRGDEPKEFTNQVNLGDGPDDNYLVTIPHYGMGVEIADKPGEPIFAGELSAGVQSIFLVALHLSLKIVNDYKQTERWRDLPDNWHSKPAILLIDEIENHLHPTWQRRVIPALLDHFKGLQIFATTHSPFVVAGLKAGQIHKLYKNNRGTICTERNAEDVVGWTVEEILREFMEVSDPTDEATAKCASVLRWLRYQQPEETDIERWQHAKIVELQRIAHPHPDQSAALQWLSEEVNARGDAFEWWRSQIAHLEEILTPELETHGPIAAQNQILMRQLADLLEGDGEPTSVDGEEPD